MEIKLIAMDMDATLLQDDHKTVSARNRCAIEAAIAKGVLVVPASGRMRTFLPQQLMDIPGIRYAISSNGAAVHDLEKDLQIYANFIPNQTVLKVFDEIPLEKYLFEIYVDGFSYIDKCCQERLSQYGLPTEMDELIYKKRNVVEDIRRFVKEENPGVEKINLPYIQGEFRNELWDKLVSFGSLEITSSVPCNMEINSATCNKGDALSHLCSYLNLNLSSTMALGDGENDIKMLKVAGLSVAMENSGNEVKAAAKAITASNMEDGLAQAIEKYVLL